MTRSIAQSLQLGEVDADKVINPQQFASDLRVNLLIERTNIGLNF